MPYATARSETHAYVAVPPEDYHTSVCGGDFIDDQTMTPGNGAVNVFDLFYLLQNWGANPEGDLNGDGATDVFDLFVLLANWNTSGPGADLAEPTDVVDVFDLFVLLHAWGSCFGGSGCPVNSLETELTNAGLTTDDWDEFEYTLTEGPEKDRENYVCWMERYERATAIAGPSLAERRGEAAG